MDKNILIIVLIILAFIALIFSLNISDSLEGIIVLLILISSLYLIWTGISDSKSSKTILGFLGVLLAIALFFWSEYNNSLRKETKEKEFQEKLRQEREAYRAEKEKQKIAHIKDSLKMLEDSQRLYAQEGDTIFGDFCFGMPYTAFNRLREKIERETNGLISIANHDFRIDNFKFYDNKLYLLSLKSARTWVRYYYHDAHEYDDSEGLADGSTIVKKIKERFSNKYGLPNKDDQWHFTYKDIHVRSGMFSRTKEGLLSTEFWAIFIHFTNPIIELEAEKASQKKSMDVAKKQKEAERELKRKKESFGSGL